MSTSIIRHAALILASCLVNYTAEAVELRVDFDEGFATSSGVSPLAAENLLTSPGHVGGQAGLFLDDAALAYPIGEGYDPNRGTLSMWVQPSWNSAEFNGDVYFWGVENDPQKDNRTVLGFLGRDGRGTVYFGPDGALGGLAASVDWKKGEWHHLVVCWDRELRCAALYIDGERRHVIESDRSLPSIQDRFYVGGLPCVTRWMGVLDGHQARAAIDEFSLTNQITEPDFAGAALLAAEDGKAQKRFEMARDAAKPAYDAAFDRLREGITLDGVARDGMEVGWDDLVGMGAPLSQHIPIQVRDHYDPIFVHPDMSIALGTENDSLGLGLALGESFELPDTYAVTRRLRDGYLPIVDSEWNTANCRIAQSALSFLADGGTVREGNEPQYVAVRLTVTNTSDTRIERPLYLLVGEMGGRQNTNYQPFVGSAARWMAPSFAMRVENKTVFLGDRAFMIYTTDREAAVTVHTELPTATTDPLMPTTLTNALAFQVALEPNESLTIELIAAATPSTDTAASLPAFREMRFDDQAAKVHDTWSTTLSSGATLTTPEPRLNEIYKALIVSSLNNMTKRPGRPYVEPNQVPVWRAVWPWEFIHMSIPLSSLGFHNELEPAFRFFTERQTGLGPYEEPGRGPEGEVRSTYGCFSGNFLLRWMCETGAVLWGMAENYRYSGDTAWLAENKESILAAWDWIQGERARTRRFDASGAPEVSYGLLPRGRVHDWNDWHYFLSFSDNYTWKGMSEMAHAFEQAGFPEATRMRAEADEYRQCINDAVDRIQFTDPETGLLFVPNVLHYDQGERGGIWWADGPIALFGTGLLDATADPRFESTVQYIQAKWGMLLGMVGSMDESENPDKKNPLWYVNLTERTLFQNYLARGETEKAILMLYSTLVCGLSHDCYQTVERIHVSNPNFAPFQPNASGNGRLLEMMRRVFVDDQEPGVVRLLRGCPRRWSQPGNDFGMERVPTPYGLVTVLVHAEDAKLTLTVDVPEAQPLREMQVALRLPVGKTPTAVTVNGTAALMENEAVAIPNPRGRLTIECTY